MRRAKAKVSLVITGQQTEYTDQLRYLTKSLGLEDATHFIGLVTEEDLSRLYRDAAVYVYPSPEEDFGMGIVEAMAAGTPVVAWNNGGPTVTVKDGESGFLITPYDTDEFARKILMLATDIETMETMGRAAHKRASEMFAYDRHNMVLESVLKAVVEGRRWADTVSVEPVDMAAGARMTGDLTVSIPKREAEIWKGGSPGWDD
jgi:glycosyltransferase involved in cell wall biosynthesis